ncbi:MAG: glycosyltransferase family 4 protein [Proteobacteria bacterium]|nr:glycosyltransferase family 4 protein [Pseudomonadota bacterium]
MRITYVARSFLDYRVPVLEHLNELCGNQLRFISSTKWTPQRALDRLRTAIGENAIYLSGEKSIGVDSPIEANVDICIPYQPSLLRSILKTRPDVLVGDGFFQWTYAALLLRMMKGIPMVVCYERWAHTERSAQWYRRLYRKMALRFTDAVCCSGSLSRKYTISLGMPSAGITTGHMTADTEALAAYSSNVTNAEKNMLRSEYRWAGTVFLCVGQLIARKGITQMLDTWAKFETTAADATLLIVGGGPEEQSLKEQQARLGLKRVHFAGPVDYSRIALFYAASDVFVIPTLEDNWSLVVPEAMACGLPILCSKYNGCWPELVQEGLNGWVFDPLNPADFLKCLKEAVKARGNLKKMGGESKRIVGNHSQQKAAEAIYSCCEIALKNR